MKRSAIVLLVLCLLAPAAVAWAALPGKPGIAIGATRWCHNIGGRGGHTSIQCDYSGTTMALRGWKLTNGNCTVAGAFDANEQPFRTTMSYGSSSYTFSVIPGRGAGQAIHFEVSCPLSWTGAVGLAWSHRITGGSPGWPIQTLRVHNGTASRHVVPCRVFYLTNLHQIRSFVWAPRVPAHGQAHTAIRVWRVKSMACSYTLHRALTGHGSA